MNENQCADKNCDYRGKIGKFYWSAAIATVVYLILTTLEILGVGKFPGFVTEAYLAILGNYAVNNSIFKYKKDCAILKRQGEKFVYIFWIYFGVISLVGFFTKGGVQISFDLMEAFMGVTVIFGGSTFFNMLFCRNNNGNNKQ